MDLPDTYQIIKRQVGPYRYRVTLNNQAVDLASTYWGARFCIWRNKRARRRHRTDHVVYEEHQWQ